MTGFFGRQGRHISTRTLRRSEYYIVQVKSNVSRPDSAAVVSRNHCTGESVSRFPGRFFPSFVLGLGSKFPQVRFPALLAIHLFCLVSTSSAQIAFVQTTTCGSGTFPATVCTIPATGSGHLIVVAWTSAWGSAPVIAGMTDNAQNVYAEAGDAMAVLSSGDMVDIWYAKNSMAGATAITITPNPAGTSGAAVIWEFANADPAAPLDQTAVLNSQPASMSPMGAPVTTTAAAEVVVSVLVPGATISGLYPGNPFTSDSLFYGTGWAHLITSATGTYAAQWSTASGPYASSTVSFKAAGSGGAGGQNPCDLNDDGVVNDLDVQLAVSMTLGLTSCTANVDGLDVCDVIVVQRVVDAAMGGQCVVGNPHSVTLNWTASTSSNVAGYNVYRGTVSGGPYAKLNTSLVPGTSYMDGTVQAGQTYYYVATAVDTSGNESTYSNEAQAVVPYP